MDEAERAWPVPPGLLNPVPSQRARLLLAQDEVAAAARWIQERGLSADDEPVAAASAQGRTGSLIELGALRALALADTGYQAGAVNALAEALTIAFPGPMSGSSPTKARPTALRPSPGRGNWA
jgi:hypothetical protein